MFMKCQRGQTAIEYALLAVVLVTVVASAQGLVSRGMEASFFAADDTIENVAIGNAGDSPAGGGAPGVGGPKADPGGKDKGAGPGGAGKAPPPFKGLP